jgi:hypothetical protein
MQERLSSRIYHRTNIAVQHLDAYSLPSRRHTGDKRTKSRQLKNISYHAIRLHPLLPVRSTSRVALSLSASALVDMVGSTNFFLPQPRGPPINPNVTQNFCDLVSRTNCSFSHPPYAVVCWRESRTPTDKLINQTTAVGRGRRAQFMSLDNEHPHQTYRSHEKVALLSHWVATE